MLRYCFLVLLVSMVFSFRSATQDRSIAVPILFPLFDRSDLPLLGIGHFLRSDYANGSFFAASEGLTYYLLRTPSVKRDTLAYPCVSTPSILYRRGLRGFSPDQSAMIQRSGYLYQTFGNLRFLDAFMTYRNYRASEVHAVPLSSEPIAGLFFSPFQWSYLKEPDVYIPLLLTAGIGFFDQPQGPSLFNIRGLNWFGHDVSPTTAGIGSTLLEAFGFTLLAVAEEGLFRGVIQTELSERVNPNFGLIASSILFGLGHYPLHGLTYSLRATAGGLYLGWRFKESGYDLRHVIAIHFYIDFMPTIIQLFRDPVSARGSYSVDLE